MSDIDIDDLLDDALEQLDEQDKEREEAKEEEQRAHDEAAQQLMMEEGLGGADKELLDVLGKLMGSLGQPGPDGMPTGGGGGPGGEQDLDSIHKSLEKVIAGLSKDCNGEEDQAQLAQCSELLTKLGTTDNTPHEPSEEELKMMHEAMQQVMQNAQGEPGADGAMPPGMPGMPGMPPMPPGMGGNPPENPEEAQKQVEEMIAQLQAHQAELMKDGPPQEGAGGLPNVPPMPTDGSLQNVLQQILSPAIISAPFKASHKAFPEWFEKHSDGTSEDDMGRFKKQFSKIGELLDLMDKHELDKAVADGASDESRQALDQFIALVEELQALGQPPQKLTELIEAMHKEEAERAAAEE